MSKTDLCGCRSGKKFENCCETFIDFMIASNRILNSLRPVIGLSYQNELCVGINNKTYYKNNCRGFWDFLEYYIVHLLGLDWFNKPYESKSSRHPLIKWCESLEHIAEKSKATPDRVRTVTAHEIAYMSFAYCLYLMENYNLLNNKQIERLKDINQFQGMYHEVTVISNFIRAGYEIEYEDESDGSSSHCEFVATSKIDGKKFSVEAKSRSRSGVLGCPGERNDAEIKVEIHNLLYKALKKQAQYTRIIIIDVNMPPIENISQNLKDIPWFEDIIATIEKKETILIKGKKAPPAYIIFTNNPHDWTDMLGFNRGGQTIGLGFNIPGFKTSMLNHKSKYMHRHFIILCEVFGITLFPINYKPDTPQEPNFSYFYDVFSAETKESLLKRHLMKISPDFEFYKKLSRKELFVIYCEKYVEYANS